MIKNAIIYRIKEPIDVENLAQALEHHRFVDPLPSEASSSGFVPLFDNDELACPVGSLIAGVFRQDKKSIPGAYKKELFKERCEKIEHSQGYAPGRKQQKEIKEEIELELLPKAFASPKKTLFILWNDLLLIDTSSTATADALLGFLVKAFDGACPFELFNFEKSPSACLTDWLVGGDMPEGLSLGHETHLLAPLDKASVQWKKESAAENQVAEHIQAGKTVKKLELWYEDKLSFNLSDQFVFSKIKHIDVKSTQGDSSDEDDEEADKETTLYLEAQSIRQAIDCLIQCFSE